MGPRSRRCYGRRVDDEHLQDDDARSGTSLVRTIIIPLLIVITIAIIVQSFLLRPYEIPTASMEPAINAGDRVLVNKMVYRMRDIERGDVVVFDPTPAAKDACNIPLSDATPFVKRVIGVGGDVVTTEEDGRTLVNGSPVQVQGQSANWTSATWRVPPGNIFVLGDNRVDSCDSSHWTEPFVPVGNVLGSVQLRYWPLSAIGPV